MTYTRFLTLVVLVMTVGGVCFADAQSIMERETLTNGFFGLNNTLSDYGIEMAAGYTNIYLVNTRGGLDTHRKAGRWSGSYDLELMADMEKLMGIEGGTLYMHAEGSWSKTDYDSDVAVGSAFGINGDYAGRRAIDLTEFWYEQSMLDSTLLLRVGKLDITGGFECRGCPVSFDGSAFANDETSQFLNSALVNNPTIPFPDKGLGIVLHWNPIEWWYASAGVADAQADAKETGFNTTFHGEDYFFYVFETGVVPQIESSKGPLQGAYRVGLWYDPQPKAHSDSSNEGRDDVGVYTSCDQMLIKENDEAEDSQGLGGFFRFGYANSQRNDIANFWSLGVQYQGLIEGRDDDVAAVGYARGIFSNLAKTTYTDDYESVLEVYYNAQVTPWLNVSPLMQWVANPGGVKGLDNAVVLGVRTQMTF